MEVATCLNLCDISNNSESLKKISKNAITNYERVYLGSYFCAQFFLNIHNDFIKNVISLYGKNNIKITLVIPIFSQSNLINGKEKIKTLLDENYLGENKGVIDEITVNDWAMIKYLYEIDKNININIGRLLLKDYREPRYKEYFNIPYCPKFFNRYTKELVEKNRIKGIEFDETHSTLDFKNMFQGITVAVHQPYTYMTTGRICEYASVDKEISKKFRANCNCSTQCLNSVITYKINDTDNSHIKKIDWIRLGKTVLFKNKGCKLNNIKSFRVIHLPVSDLFCKLQ